MAKISLEFIAPVRWKSGPRKRGRWISVTCLRTVDIPVLSPAEAPVAIEVRTNPALEHDQNCREFDGRSRLLRWRTHSQGVLVADVAETEYRPSYSVPWKSDTDRLTANGPSTVALDRNDNPSRTITFDPHPSRFKRRVPEWELADGTVLEDCREEAEQAALLALKGVVFVGSRMHVPVPEPVLLVASHALSDHRRRGYKFVGSCVVIECHPDGMHCDPVHQNYAESLRLNAKQIFRIDQIDDAIAAASTDWRGIDRWIPSIAELDEPPIHDRVRIAPDYTPQAVWLSRTFGLTERRARTDAFFQGQNQELLKLLDDARGAAIRYETTGQGWNELIEATDKLVDFNSTYSHILGTLTKLATKNTVGSVL